MEDTINIGEIYETVGERIDEWIDHSLTFENGCKRNCCEDDDFNEEDVSWIFTQKGSRLYDNYLRRVSKLIDDKYPNELLEDLSSYTSVFTP